MFHWKRARTHIHACIYMFEKNTHTEKSERKKGVAYDEAFAVVCCCWIIVTIASETEQFRRSFSFRMCL